MLILILFTSLTTQAQTNKTKIIEGFVVNAKTKEPIPYANIGILDTEIGTLSNRDGSFSIKMPTEYESRNLLFSSIGYEKKSIRINTIKTSEPLKVSLTERISKLDEVTISSEKFKKEKVQLGNGKSLLLNAVLRGDSTNAGAAIALLIDRSQYPDHTFIHGASLHIGKNIMPSFKVRMRLLAIDSANGQKPGDDIFFEQIIEESSIKKGWMDFPFPPSIQIEQSAFYLTFEWILTRKERVDIDDKYAEYLELYPDRVSYDTAIIDGEVIVDRLLPKAIAGTYFGVTSSKKDRERFVCYARGNSFGEWERMGDILSAKIVLANYPQTSTATEESNEDYSVADAIDQWAKAFKAEQNIPGLQLAAMKGDSLFYSNAFGYSDQTNKTKANTNTQFRIASVSKTLTSAAVMKLVAEGKIDLEESVQHYVPSFPQKKYPITVGQLLGHLGGIRHYYGISWEKELFIQEHYNNATEAMVLFSHDSLVAEPGTKFVYSSFGYMLLGAIIERVTNRPYLEYMKKEIWDPLNMDFTYGDIADSVMAHKSKFYYYNGEEAKPYDLSYTHPSGGLLSTAEDLVNFGSVLLDGKLLSQPILDQVFSTQHTSDGQPTGYGLGWYVGNDFNGNEVWYHAGELPSSGSMIVIYPEYRLIIAVLANSPIISDKDDGFSNEIQRLGEMIYNHKGWQ